MLLKHARQPIDGQPIGNTFEAIDEKTGLLLANCTIYAHENPVQFPHRPLRICLRFDGSPIPDILLGGAIARAKGIAYERRLPGRIYAEVFPEDDQLMEMLQLQGFADNDGLIRMVRPLEDESAPELPARCVIVVDKLDDPIEQKYFLERYNQIHNTNYKFDWLQVYCNKQGFKRILIVSPKGMVGECVIWNDGEQGLIDWLFVAKRWRGNGVSAILMDAACSEFANDGKVYAAVNVHARMPRMLRIIESAGFHQSEVIWRYPGVDVDPE